MAEVMKTVVNIEGMRCSSCAYKVEQALLGVEGVVAASVNFATAQARVEGEVSVSHLAKAVAAVGYAINQSESRFEKLEEELRAVQQRAFLALILSIPTFIISMAMIHFPGSGILQLLLTSIVLYLGKDFFIGAFQQAQRFSANMDTLVSLGAGSGFLFSVAVLLTGGNHLYFEGTSGIIAFILLGKYLEENAKYKSSRTLRSLINLRPTQARKLVRGEEIECEVSEIKVDDTLIVLAGDAIPVDGIIIEGVSRVDESMVTGESFPVSKEAKDLVIAGTLNDSGRLVIKATRVGKDTWISHMLSMVEEALSSKPPIQRVADQVSGVFVPIVLVIAAVTFCIWFFQGNTSLFLAVSHSIAVLLIACPCALGLATPTAILVGTTRAAEHGILIRDARALELCSKVDVLVFDKTGTLTYGEPQVVEFERLTREYSMAQIASFLGTVEKSSTHPIAKAIVKYADGQSATFGKVENHRSITGQGVEARVDGVPVKIGRPGWLKKEFSEIPDKTTSAMERGYTVVFATINAKPAAIISVGDNIRAEATATIAQLRSLGIIPILASGDHGLSVRSVAKEVGISQVIAEMMPEEKLAEVKSLQENAHVVAMVGDGINDAPALAQADVGIAVANATDAAKETAGILLLDGDLRKVVECVILSKRILKTIHQNLGWAFIYNLAAIPVAALGYLNPMIASAAMALSSVSVVMNSLRIRK